MLQLTTTITTVVLARILVPADFGAVAAALVIVAMFDVLTHAGFGSSLVRRKELDHRETSTIFWLAAGTGLLVSALAAGLSGPLASLIGQPHISALVAALAVTILLSLLRSVGRSLLLREFRFRPLAVVDISSLVLYGVVAIALASLGLGPWAIVIGYIARGTLAALLVLIAARWAPSLTFDRKFVRGELAFSGGILGQQTLNYLRKNLDYWVVGAVLGAATLGVYYIAFVIPDLIRRRLTDVAREVLYPVLARIGVDNERARLAYLRVVRTIAFVSLPAMVGIALLADSAIEVAFGSQWRSAAAPMAVLSLASAITAVTGPSLVVTNAEGRPHLAMPAQLAGVIALVVGLAATAPSRDLTTMSWSVVVAAFVTSSGLQITIGRIMRLPTRLFLGELAPAVLSSAAMALVIWAIKSPVLTMSTPVLGSIVLVAIGILFYLGAYWLTFRSQLREEMRSLRLVILPQSTTS